MIRTGLIASAAALAVCVGAWLWLANALPQDATLVPVHWDLSGEADRFVTREEALALFALLPGTSVALTILLALIQPSNRCARTCGAAGAPISPPGSAHRR